MRVYKIWADAGRAIRQVFNLQAALNSLYIRACRRYTLWKGYGWSALEHDMDDS